MGSRLGLDMWLRGWHGEGWHGGERKDECYI